MASLLKPKLGISVFSITILILIPLLESNFNAPVTIKRWSKLTWDDFQGFVQPLSKYEAVIASSVYLEYDSVHKRFHAYAGQNNIRSWAKRSRPDQDYELNHEQYHFNITELHARRLNHYIAENPGGSPYLYNLRHGSINIDLRKMQREYDSETDHSLIFDRQRRWEYRIDSLLVLDSGWVTDHFSGGKAFFPAKPKLVKGTFENGTMHRGHRLSKYDMTLALYAYQNRNIDPALFGVNWPDIYANNAMKVKSVVSDTLEYGLKTLIIAEDTINYTDYSLWVYNDAYLYKAQARFPNNMGDTTGYAQIARSFINSFRIVDTDDYWIAKLESSDSPILLSTVSNRDENEKEQDTEYCMHVGPPSQPGFYRGPFYRDDGAMFLACDYIVHPDSLHYQDVMLLNKDWYSHTPTPHGQIYFVPAKNIPKQKFDIKFGYILLEDSVKDCYEFYHEKIEITRKIHVSSNTEL